jgi:hypothetical protein
MQPIFSCQGVACGTILAPKPTRMEPPPEHPCRGAFEFPVKTHFIKEFLDGILKMIYPFPDELETNKML